MVLGVPMQAKSLWTDFDNNEHGMYADARACSVGDIVTVVVSENSSMANNMSLTTSRDSNIGFELKDLLYAGVIDGTYDGASPKTDINLSANDHAGSGSMSNTQTLSTYISVQVVDVLPNGNLVLEGMRKVSYSGETYYMITRGICRKYDVNSDNQVNSSMIADASIEVVTEGTLTETQRKGWLMKLADRFSF
jgi:flagellar L-ring protein precursor FlgH